jgi:hypothetical protein
MDSTQTLHDFVLNLLTNSEARSAFQLDPEGALNEAGLSDITAADVQDVVPLVVDYASVQSKAGLAPAAGDLDLGALGTDPTNAISQLQAVAQQLAVIPQPTSIDGGVAAAGAIAVDASALGVSANGWAGAGITAGTSGVSADLFATQDVAGTLDAEVVDSVTAEATGVLDAGALGGGLPVDALPVGGLPVDGVLGGGPVDGVLGTAGSAVGNVTSQVEDATGAVDSLGLTEQLPTDVPDLGAEGGGPALSGATGAVDGALDRVGGLLDGGPSADASGTGSADSDLLGATDILF